MTNLIGEPDIACRLVIVGLVQPWEVLEEKYQAENRFSENRSIHPMGRGKDRS